MRLGWLSLIFAGCASVPPSSPSPVAPLPDYVRTPAATAAPKQDYKFDETDTSCGGFPRLAVETFPGSCLGMVLPKARSVDPVTKRGFSMPRTMVQIPGTRDFLVVDMGSWHMGRGALFRMSWDGTQYGVRVLKEGLNYPHAIKLGPDGKFWMNELKEISRFSLADDGSIAGWEKMIVDLPAFPETDAHPLTQFVFDPRTKDVYVNLGAPSDHCLSAGAVMTDCPEVRANDLSSIVRISWADLQKPPVRKWTVVARGLRNSVALVVTPTGLLIQGENARDFSDSSEPFEEMNVVDPSKPVFNHGWPYCYDFRAKSPEWLENTKVKCDAGVAPVREGDYAEPYILIPPHAAPLTAGYYHGPMFPSLEGKLLMTWHGYRKTGHRLVAYTVDSRGRPMASLSAAPAIFNVDRKEDGCATQSKMEPAGGMQRHAPYSELITRWNLRKNMRPRGAPVSFYVTDDGSIWIIEDKNQTISRLSVDKRRFVPEACDPHADDRMELLAWRRAVKESPTLLADYHELHQKLIVKYCASCHDNGVDKSLVLDSMSGLDFMVNSGWFVKSDTLEKSWAKSPALQAIIHEGTVPGMPMAGSPQFFGTPEGDDLIARVKKWIGDMPSDIDSRYEKTVMKTARKVRLAPGGAECGAMAAGSTAYLDPRASSEVNQGGWTWKPLYLPPDHVALKGSSCKWPDDGVFYVATTPLH